MPRRDAPALHDSCDRVAICLPCSSRACSFVAVGQEKVGLRLPPHCLLSIADGFWRGKLRWYGSAREGYLADPGMRYLQMLALGEVGKDREVMIE